VAEKEVSLEISVLLQHGFRYAISLTHDHHQAEDILQDAWLAVMKAGGPHSKAYLFSAVRSRFLNANKRANLVSIVILDDVEELEDKLLDTEVDFDVNGGVLEIALSQLRDVEREVLFLFAVEGYTAQEIAVLTERPRGTVLSLLHRGRKKIRRFVDQHDAKVML